LRIKGDGAAVVGVEGERKKKVGGSNAFELVHLVQKKGKGR